MYSIETSYSVFFSGHSIFRAYHNKNRPTSQSSLFSKSISHFGFMYIIYMRMVYIETQRIGGLRVRFKQKYPADKIKFNPEHKALYIRF